MSVNDDLHPFMSVTRLNWYTVVIVGFTNTVDPDPGTFSVVATPPLK